MIARALLAFFGVALLAMPAMAQDYDSYERGYNAGYNDGPPPSDTYASPGDLSLQGYQDGQYDSDKDAAAEARSNTRMEDVIQDDNDPDQ